MEAPISTPAPRVAAADGNALQGIPAPSPGFHDSRAFPELDEQPVPTEREPCVQGVVREAASGVHKGGCVNGSYGRLRQWS